MPNKMLIDATHPEETRVVVVRGNRVEEFDFETAQRKQLRGNIYLAKVTRVEPSLQAAFIEYGGNRHGFLAFSEIHPDYYQIPVADRERLIAEQQRMQAEAEDEPEPEPDKVDRTDILEAREDAAAEKAAAIGEAAPPAIEEPAMTETAETPPAEAAPVDSVGEVQPPEPSNEAAPETRADETRADETRADGTRAAEAQAAEMP